MIRLTAAEWIALALILGCAVGMPLVAAIVLRGY